MGKALLVIVLGSGLILTTQLYNTSQQERETSEDQVAYQEEVIAREIAQSAFNVGMGVIRSHGEKLQQGVVDLNGTSNAGRSGTHSSGRFAGGAYKVKAELTSGHSVRVLATGRYGDAEFSMHDEYRVPVLIARHDGLLDVSFLESMAGYCSAVFYQAYMLGMPEGTVPEPVMLFAPDNRDRTTARPAQTIYVSAGTQMNFFIAVDTNCSMRLPASTPECEVREYAQDYDFDASDFDYIHYALDVKAGELDQAQEAAWGLTEQHPNDRQRWRIAWEDLDRDDWIQASSNNPSTSLQALKRLGYDLVGWPTADSRGYRTLRDYGSRPDFSDQVIEVQVINASSANFHGKMTSARAKQAACGEDVDEQIQTTPVPIPDPLGLDDTSGSGTTSTGASGSSSSGSSSSSASSSSSSGGYTQEQILAFACDCTSNGTKSNKTAILHRPPGNESNEQLLCVGTPSVPSHFGLHNDIYPSCLAGSAIKNKNK